MNIRNRLAVLEETYNPTEPPLLIWLQRFGMGEDKSKVCFQDEVIDLDREMDMSEASEVVARIMENRYPDRPCYVLQWLHL